MADITLKSVITDGFIMLLSAPTPYAYTLGSLIFLFSLSSVCLAVFLFDHLAEPAHHGFFCNDRSLMHPYHRDTIPTMSLIIVGVVIPASTVSPAYRRWRNPRIHSNFHPRYCTLNIAVLVVTHSTAEISIACRSGSLSAIARCYCLPLAQQQVNCSPKWQNSQSVGSDRIF